MQEVKLSTRIKGEKSAELAIKLDVESLGLKWKAGDIIRMKATDFVNNLPAPVKRNKRI